MGRKSKRKRKGPIKEAKTGEVETNGNAANNEKALPTADELATAQPSKKKQRRKGSTRDNELAEKQSHVFQESEPSKPTFPFPTDADDHCESPLDAYRDILPLLNFLRGDKRNVDVSIYDPYYCDGAMKRNFQQLGFPNVYNEKEDCYKIWADSSKYPSYEALVTNPPYSGDHIERLINHVTSCTHGRRPWFLLLPNWVHKKDYFINRTKHLNPFYIVPHKRYIYTPPQNFRESKKSDVHKKSSPFVSMWYVFGGSEQVNAQMIRRFHQGESASRCDLARSKSALRDLRRKKR